MAKRRWLVAAAVVAVLGIGAGALTFAVPGLAATACPGCYGLTGPVDAGGLAVETATVRSATRSS